jgi:hypothetical protein
MCFQRDTGSPFVAQAGIELTLYPQLASNSQSSCHCLPSAGIEYNSASSCLSDFIIVKESVSSIRFLMSCSLHI